MVYDKTDKGREEIATRKYHLSSRLRTLLVMIDGRLGLDALLKNFAGIGVTEENFNELVQEGYISLISGGEPAPAAPARPSASARPRPVAKAPDGTQDDAHDGAVPAVASAPAAAPVDEAERFRHLYDFYNQTIKSTIGLRGIMLQLKVEKCSNIEDFRQLRLQYLEAVLKARGSEMARSLRGRLDELLGGKPEREDFILPDN